MIETIAELKTRIRERLEALQHTFSRAALGDFSQDVEMYDEEDELTETFVGVQIMLEVIRGQLGELTALNTQLAKQLDELNQEMVLRKELERRKDEFITILGHELRNPVAPIRYAAQLIGMQAHDDNTELAENARIIERQSTHLSRLINDLLEASRIMHGKIDIKPEPSDLATILEHAIETAMPAIKEKKHAIQKITPSEQITIQADPLRLEQILVNLLTNAARYTPVSGHITVEARRKDSHVSIAVCDTGIGIAPHLLENIFDIFVQHKDSKEHKGGLGLGLMIARGLARLQGGDLTAKSDGPGTGSVFTVLVPISAHSHVPVAKPKQHMFSRKRILIIDDNSDLANTVAAMLRHHGHEVHIAYDGTTGIRMARVIEPETIFLDLAMPDMDGFGVIGALRNKKSATRARVVALTGFGQLSDFERTKAAGFDDHLVKPPAIEQLLEVLDHSTS